MCICSSSKKVCVYMYLLHVPPYNLFWRYGYLHNYIQYIYNYVVVTDSKSQPLG